MVNLTSNNIHVYWYESTMDGHKIMTKEIKNKTEHYYVNAAGQKHGEYKSYWNNGKLRIHCHYNNGKLHGEDKAYWHNGQLWTHCHYNNGTIHGEDKAYYCTEGQIVQHKHYNANGEHHGEYKWCEVDGKLRFHLYYVNGEVMHDFIKDGDSELIREQLHQQYGAPLMVNGKFINNALTIKNIIKRILLLPSLKRMN